MTSRIRFADTPCYGSVIRDAIFKAIHGKMEAGSSRRGGLPVYRAGIVLKIGPRPVAAFDLLAGSGAWASAASDGSPLICVSSFLDSCETAHSARKAPGKAKPHFDLREPTYNCGTPFRSREKPAHEIPFRPAWPGRLFRRCNRCRCTSARPHTVDCEKAGPGGARGAFASEGQGSQRHRRAPIYVSGGDAKQENILDRRSHRGREKGRCDPVRQRHGHGQLSQQDPEPRFSEHFVRQPGGRHEGKG